MPSKMSWFNKEMIRHIARSSGWISIVYFLGLLFILPIAMLMMYSNEHFPDYEGHNFLFQLNFEFQLGLLVIVPVILAVFLFRFLHVKQASDLMHSLPLKREKIFHHYVLTGMVFLIAPVVVITLIIMILHSTLDFGRLFTLEDLFDWAGTTTVIALILYTASVMIAMVTGISAVHAILSYIFLFFPFGFVLLLFNNLKILFYGFPSDFFLDQQLEKMSPITYAATLNGRGFHWNDAALFLIISVVFYAAALLIYKKRKVEQASEAIAFPKLRSVFKYGVTFCTMILGGTYFSGVSDHNLAWTIFGYVIGTIFGYFIAEMVLQKTWRVFGRVKGLAVYAAIVIVLVLGVKTLGIYDNRLPDVADIRSVQLTNDPRLYLNHSEKDEDYNRMKPMKEKANIAAVQRMHRQILADRNLKHRKHEPLTDFYIHYELKNGSSLTREYSVNERLYDDFFKPIYESEEYKLAAKSIFKVKENKIKTINISAYGPLNKKLLLSDPEEIKEALSALRKDMLAESYQDSVYYHDRGSMIEIFMGDGQVVDAGEFNPGYHHFSKWLKKKNLLNRAAVTAEDFSHALIVKVDLANKGDMDPSKKELESKEGSLVIRDKRQMGQVLDQASASVDKEYKVIFYYKIDDSYEIMSFDEDHAPDFVKKHFLNR